ncbi:ATP-dependent RNA helicase DEAH11, chloroplastic [Heracleum sosnowskyi]|uniref:RBR-type E3 ubiquitin transferase n=1 Tax=Heracleum sosnowskyi TaxID=360622 RepID=A0AAD8M1Q1_9APIA|nr:ATP-dependent RNA helicase DEAH11, chloroplastic [Heracleum sosnowskyi]
MSKAVNVMEGEWMNNRVVAANALIEGLSAAVDLGLKNVVFFCDYPPLYKMVTRRWSAKQEKMAMLLNKVEILRKNFTMCRPSFVARNEVKYAFKLAREAIVSQTNKHAESSGTKIESCVICLEDVDLCQIFSVDGCMHRYCFSCMKQHVKVKLLNAILPKCPHDGCPSLLKLDSCRKFLTLKWIDIMNERLTEAAIPVTEKIYCPYPRCSALMSRTDILEYTKALYPDVLGCGVRKCMKCHGLFCVSCKVPWHTNLTCYAFKKNNNSQQAEDVKLKTLAAQNQWRQCVKCNHMIELAKGCYHMTCRCGYEFCYTCGSEWKNKKATCTCPLWDDDHIVDDDYDDDEYGEVQEEVGNYDDYFDSDSDDEFY